MHVETISIRLKEKGLLFRKHVVNNRRVPEGHVRIETDGIQYFSIDGVIKRAGQLAIETLLDVFGTSAFDLFPDGPLVLTAFKATTNTIYGVAYSGRVKLQTLVGVVAPAGPVAGFEAVPRLMG